MDQYHQTIPPPAISPHMWNSLIVNSTDVIMIVDVTGKILYVNHVVEGFVLEDVIGSDVREFVPSEQADKMMERLRRVFETGEPESEEIFADCPSNSNAWYLSRVAPVNHDGRTIALSITSTDITSHKTAQRNSEDAEARLHSILNNVAYGIISIDGLGQMDSVNKAVEQMFGYEADELIGSNIKLLMPSKYSTHHDGYLSTHYQTGEMKVIGQSRELEGQRKDGSIFPIELTVTEFSRDEGVMYTGIIVDITQRKQTEIELQHSQKMEAIGLLAGGVAHDFNNMLSAIMSYTYLITEKIPEDSEISEYGAEIQKASERAAGLTRQLLTFSRQDVAEPKVVDVGLIVKELLKMIRHLIAENIELVFRPASGLWKVMVDVGHMEQVILNLAINARDAMPDGGQLKLDISNLVIDKTSSHHVEDGSTGEYVVMTVSDNGIGMTQDVKARIFEPFYTTKGIGKGTGLGLSTCHGIVSRMGGHIAVDSTPNMGTTFRVYIPRTTSSTVTPSRRIESVSQFTGTGTVLLVEDESMLRNIAVLTLRQNGYTVIPSTDGLDALHLAEGHTGTIDLLLTDVVMPRMGGLELSASLKDKYPDMRVLYTSGYIDDPEIREIISTRPDNFLRKPYNPPELLQKIRTIQQGSEEPNYVEPSPNNGSNTSAAD